MTALARFVVLGCDICIPGRVIQGQRARLHVQEERSMSARRRAFDFITNTPAKAMHKYQTSLAMR